MLEPRTALAYERSELVADETAARVAALAAWRSGRARILVASVQALIQHTIAPDDLPADAAELRVGARLTRRRCCASCSSSATSPVLEVAGRGEFARRGGIVDVFPPSLTLPVRIEFFGDEIDSLRPFDPTDQRTTGKVDRAVVLPASEFLLPDRGRGRDPRRASARWPRQLPERLAGDLARFEGDADRPGCERRRHRDRSDAGSGRRRRGRGLGAQLAPATGLDHIEPGTLLVLDEPGDVAEAAEFLWRQADERRAELVEAGELPEGLAVDLPRAARLEGPAARLADAGADLGVGAAGRHGDGGGRSMLGRPVRVARAGPAARPGGAPRRRGRGLARGRRADRHRLGPGAAPRRAPRGGRPSASAVVDRIAEAPPPGAIALVDRSLNGGFGGGPDGSCSSPIASCSAPSASAGRRRCAGSCRATSSSG